MNQKGFTLVELIMTLAIIGLLATLTLPMAELAVQHSKEQELRVALRQIREALDAYKQASDDGRIERSAGSSGYPTTLQVLVDGVSDIKNPTNENQIYFLRRLPRDPMSADENAANDETWGKRSYKSSPDDPQEGDDVFDIYSVSTGTGLNGVPYSQW